MSAGAPRCPEALIDLVRFYGFKLVPITVEPSSPLPAAAPIDAPSPWPAERLKAVRMALQLSQRTFATRIGLPGANAFTSISKMENGREKIPIKYHDVLTALEFEARRKVTSGTAAAPAKPIASPPPAGLMKPLRRKEACGCERIFDNGPTGGEGRLVRQCGAHTRELKYQPKPPRVEPRPPKSTTVPLPRAQGPGDVLCACRHPARDHEQRRFRCYACGTGHGAGCQLFKPSLLPQEK